MEVSTRASDPHASAAATSRAASDRSWYLDLAHLWPCDVCPLRGCLDFFLKKTTFGFAKRN